jgi:hypothetical protein
MSDGTLMGGVKSMSTKIGKALEGPHVHMIILEKIC